MNLKYKKNFWYQNDFKSKLISNLLLPLSFVWIIINELKRKLIVPYKSNIKVVCVGNLNIGGTGKTPLCIMIYDYLQKLGFNPIFLTSGYKSKIKTPVKLNKYSHSNQFGDEAVMLGKIGPTVISKSRIEGLKFIENFKNTYDIIIMDDGFQNYRIFKNLVFLAIDRKFGFGNNRCLPAGPLRQSFSSCKKLIDSIILTGNHHNHNFRFNVPTFETFIKIKKKPSDEKNYLAFSGLGNNEKFFDTLKSVNTSVIKKISFPDHFTYNNTIIEEILKIAKKLNLNVITTEKDFVKINKKYHDFIEYLPITTKLSEKEISNFNSFLINKLNG